MEFEKISTPSLKDLFIQQLENMILSGTLEVGSHLPPERELAEKMKVSRAVVNAGINDMAAKGFLEVRPRIGTFVADYRRNGTADTLISIMKYQGGHLHPNEIKSMFEIKLVLDTLAAKLVIPKLTDTELEALRLRIITVKEAETSEQTSNAVFEFYHELAFISGNTFLPLLYSSFRVPILDIWTQFGRRYGVESLHTNSSALYGDIEKRDLDGAIKHIARAMGVAIDKANDIYAD